MPRAIETPSNRLTAPRQPRSGRADHLARPLSAVKNRESFPEKKESAPSRGREGQAHKAGHPPRRICRSFALRRGQSAARGRRVDYRTAPRSGVALLCAASRCDEEAGESPLRIPAIQGVAGTTTTATTAVEMRHHAALR